MDLNLGGRVVHTTRPGAQVILGQVVNRDGAVPENNK